MTAEPMNRVHFIGLLNQAANTDDPEVLARLAEAIQEHEVDFVEYIGDTLRFIDEHRMSIVGIDAEIRRLENLKAEREARANRLESHIQWALEQIGQSDWSDDLHTVRLKRNPPKVVIESEALIPRTYIKETYKVIESIDKAAIKEALNNGIPVEGCKLVQDWRMEIK